MPEGQGIDRDRFGPTKAHSAAGACQKHYGNQNRTDYVYVGQRIEGNPPQLLGGMIALEFGNPRMSIFMDAQSQKYCKDTRYCALY
jgi:hypothetical protein